MNCSCAADKQQSGFHQRTGQDAIQCVGSGVMARIIRFHGARFKIEIPVRGARQHPSLQDCQARSWALLVVDFNVVCAARFGSVCCPGPSEPPLDFSPLHNGKGHNVEEEKRVIRRLVGCKPERYQTEGLSQPDLASVPLVVAAPARSRGTSPDSVLQICPNLSQMRCRNATMPPMVNSPAVTRALASTMPMARARMVLS